MVLGKGFGIYHEESHFQYILDLDMSDKDLLFEPRAAPKEKTLSQIMDFRASPDGRNPPGPRVNLYDDDFEPLEYIEYYSGTATTITANGCELYLPLELVGGGPKVCRHDEDDDGDDVLQGVNSTNDRSIFTLVVDKKNVHVGRTNVMRKKKVAFDPGAHGTVLTKGELDDIEITLVPTDDSTVELPDYLPSNFATIAGRTANDQSPHKFKNKSYALVEDMVQMRIDHNEKQFRLFNAALNKGFVTYAMLHAGYGVYYNECRDAALSTNPYLSSLQPPKSAAATTDDVKNTYVQKRLLNRAAAQSRVDTTVDTALEMSTACAKLRSAMTLWLSLNARPSYAKVPEPMIAPFSEEVLASLKENTKRASEGKAIDRDLPVYSILARLYGALNVRLNYQHGRGERVPNVRALYDALKTEGAHKVVNSALTATDIVKHLNPFFMHHNLPLLSDVNPFIGHYKGVASLNVIGLASTAFSNMWSAIAPTVHDKFNAISLSGICKEVLMMCGVTTTPSLSSVRAPCSYGLRSSIVDIITRDRAINQSYGLINAGVGYTMAALKNWPNPGGIVEALKSPFARSALISSSLAPFYEEPLKHYCPRLGKVMGGLEGLLLALQGYPLHVAASHTLVHWFTTGTYLPLWLKIIAHLCYNLLATYTNINMEINALRTPLLSIMSLIKSKKMLFGLMVGLLVIMAYAFRTLVNEQPDWPGEFVFPPGQNPRVTDLFRTRTLPIGKTLNGVVGLCGNKFVAPKVRSSKYSTLIFLLECWVSDLPVVTFTVSSPDLVAVADHRTMTQQAANPNALDIGSSCLVLINYPTYYGFSSSRHEGVIQLASILEETNQSMILDASLCLTSIGQRLNRGVGSNLSVSGTTNPLSSVVASVLYAGDASMLILNALGAAPTYMGTVAKLSQPLTMPLIHRSFSRYLPTSVYFLPAKVLWQMVEFGSPGAMQYFPGRVGTIYIVSSMAFYTVLAASCTMSILSLTSNSLILLRSSSPGNLLQLMRSMPTSHSPISLHILRSHWRILTSSSIACMMCLCWFHQDWCLTLFLKTSLTRLRGLMEEWSPSFHGVSRALRTMSSWPVLSSIASSIRACSSIDSSSRRFQYSIVPDGYMRRLETISPGSMTSPPLNVTSPTVAPGCSNSFSGTCFREFLKNNTFNTSLKPLDLERIVVEQHNLRCQSMAASSLVYLGPRQSIQLQTLCTPSMLSGKPRASKADRDSTNSQKHRRSSSKEMTPSSSFNWNQLPHEKPNARPSTPP